MLYNTLVLLLWSLCVNAPVLSYWNCVVGKPIALVFNDMAEVSSLIKKISPHPKVITVSTSVRTTKETLISTNSDGVFLILTNRGGQKRIKEQEKIDAVLSAANLRTLDGKETTAMVFVVCNKKVPDELKSEVFEIHVEDNSYSSEDNLLELIPSPEQLPVVCDKIQEFNLDDALPFKAAIAFFYPYFKKTNNLDRYKNMLLESEKIVQKAKEYQGNDNITELVQELLVEFITDNLDCICNFTEINSKAAKLLDQKLITKDKALFIAEEKFKAIIQPLTDIIPIDLIKERLWQDGVLQGKQGDYTAKMNFRVNGKLTRKRMLKLDLSEMPDVWNSLVFRN